MLTLEQFNSRIGASSLAPGQQFSDLSNIGKLIAEIMGFPYVIAASGAAVALTGTTSRTSLYEFNLPAKVLNINGILRIDTLWSANNDASNKTLRVTVGVTDFPTGNILNVLSNQGVCIIRSRGVYNSQISNPSLTSSMTTSGTAVVVGTEDLSIDKTVIISGQLADAADTMTLEGFVATVTPVG